MKEITTDEIVRILCGDISVLDEVLKDTQTKTTQTKNDTSEDDNCDSSGI